MNSREQYLKKQNERLEAQVLVLTKAFENLYVENELTGSFACAFAWDLATVTKEGAYSPTRYALDMWDEAVKAVGGE